MNEEANKKSKKSINNCFLAVLNKELDMYNTYFSCIYLYLKEYFMICERTF